MSALHAGAGVVESNTLGKYRLLAGLGRGGMAMVHLAVMQGPAGFNKLVVIKQMYAQYSEDLDILGMFLDEARLAARLRHHNVVQTNEVGEDGARHFMVMEFLDGQPLNRILHRLGSHGGLPLAVHLRIIADLLEGLHYAHELRDYDGTPLGVVHRDVTPQNIFVTYDGVVKIVDFGIAKARSSLVHTGAGIVKGKISYMPPEHIAGQPIDRRADIFSVGVMLWEAVTGTRPWKGAADLTVLKSVMEGRFPSARAVKPDLPDALDAILHKALARRREDRYATAAELQADLEAYLESTGERVSPRDIGGLVATHFAAERAEIEAVVQEQLRRHDAAPSGSEALLPTIDQPTTANDRPVASPEAPPAPTGPSAPSTESSAFAVTVPDQRLRVRFVQIGALVAGAALLMALGWTPKGGSAAAAVSPAVLMADAPSSSAPPEVMLRVSASPDEARVFLDDVQLSSNPFEGMVPRDGAPHRIRVEAKGFVPLLDSFTLDHDRTLDLALTREPAEADGGQPSSQQVSASPTSTGRVHARPHRLDGKNPYVSP
jgi:eukaryotic-like serine/threonine-protein kinase